MKSKNIITQLIFFVVIVAIFMILGSRDLVFVNNKVKNDVPKADKLEIYYFYANQRCDVCITLENFIKDTINEYFSKELQGGIIKFESVNIDLPENIGLVNKYQVDGAALYINSIYDNKDHIQKEENAWSYIDNQLQFRDYLLDKIKHNSSGDKD